MNAQLDYIDQPAAQMVSGPGAVPGPARLVAAEQWTPGSSDGLLLAVDAEPEQRFAGAELIAIDFPAFTDGRGLSLAVLLRTRLGFRGELRAVGDIRADMLHYLYRCGFDSFSMSGEGSPVDADGVTKTTAFDALAPYSDCYQASVRQPRPAYRRVERCIAQELSSPSF
ncbi:MAG TPA: DUF934 domain-containing protein [Pseudomonadales bacterium]|jgi:uncharacterized protein (DUF934 family)